MFRQLETDSTFGNNIVIWCPFYHLALNSSHQSSVISRCFYIFQGSGPKNGQGGSIRVIPATDFSSPSEKHQDRLSQMNSQQRVEFQPPMPRPYTLTSYSWWVSTFKGWFTRYAFVACNRLSTALRRNVQPKNTLAWHFTYKMRKLRRMCIILCKLVLMAAFEIDSFFTPEQQ